MAQRTTPDLFTKCISSKQMLRLAELKRQQAYPFFPVFEAASALAPYELQYQGQRILNFGSNDYLGLSRDPAVIAAAIEATQRFGSACSGSRLLNGTNTLHVELERQLAHFLGKEAALLVSTGYQTNLAAISAIAGKQDLLIADELCHASIADGMRLSSARMLRFRHNDLQSLEQALQSSAPAGARLVLVEGVYSVRGDTADLAAISDMARAYNARLFLDDAHGLGVFGSSGRGTAERYAVESQIDILTGTFSKAFASSGGFIAGSAQLLEFIKHAASPFVFSASMPPAAVAAALAALKVIQEEPQRRQRLLALTAYARTQLLAAGFDVIEGPSPAIILPWTKGRDLFEPALRLSRFCNWLLQQGIYANPVVGQATPAPVLRINVMAVHQEAQIDVLVATLREGRELLGI